MGKASNTRFFREAGSGKSVGGLLIYDTTLAKYSKRLSCDIVSFKLVQLGEDERHSQELAA